MPFAARWLLGLFAALPAALAAASLLQLAPPPGLPPLSQRPLWTAWALIGGWLALATTLACAKQAVRLWRWGLGALVVLLAWGALGSLVGRLPSAPSSSMALSLGLLAVGTLVLARFIDQDRVRAEHAVPRPPDSAAARRTGQGDSPGRASGWTRLRRHLARHAGFWLCGALMLASFQLAFGASADPQRGVGMLGMLLVFFIVLPAVSLASWFPRTSTGLLMAAALGFGALGWRSLLPFPLLAALLLLVLAGMAGWPRHWTLQPEGSA